MAVADTNFAVVIIIAHLQVLTLLFMTVVFEAFSKLTSRHTALVLLFSKELATHILEFYNTFVLVVFDLMGLMRPPGFNLPMLFFSTYLYFIIYVHVLAMALNRLCAVFRPKLYQRYWSKRSTILICIVVWVVGMGLASHQVVYYSRDPFNSHENTTTLLASDVGNQSDLISAFRPSMNDVVQFVVITTSMAIYFAILIKLAYEKMSSPKQQSGDAAVETALAQKDRLMLCAVFFASVIPLPLNHMIQVKETYEHSLTGNLLLILHYVNGTLLQCVDELLLFILCREFRQRVKEQMAHTLAKLGQRLCCRQQQQQERDGPSRQVQTPAMIAFARGADRDRSGQSQTPVQMLQNGQEHRA